MKTTERAYRHALALGMTVGVVERRRPMTVVNKTGDRVTVPGRTEDLFGIFDLVALRESLPGGGDPRLIGLQACGEDVQPHIVKMLDSSVLSVWLRSGAHAELWALRRRKFKTKAGKWSKATRWHVRRVVFDLAANGNTRRVVHWEDDMGWWQDGKKGEKK